MVSPGPMGATHKERAQAPELPEGDEPPAGKALGRARARQARDGCPMGPGDTIHLRQPCHEDRATVAG